MCAIIGIRANMVREAELEVVSSLILASEVRGKHATGVAYVYNSKTPIKAIIEPISASEFLKKHMDEISHDLEESGSISLIAHTRYATSGLNSHQPILGGGLALALNGVITQSAPETWEAVYGFKPQTENDAEILHHILLNSQSPSELKTASIAACALYEDGSIFAFRNGKRPLWHGDWDIDPDGKVQIYASTQEIFTRSIAKEAKMLKAGAYHNLELAEYNDYEMGIEDLQCK